MSANLTRDDLLKFMDYLSAKGLLPKPTVQNRKAAINAVLGILPPEEVADVGKLDLDAVMVRFSNLQGAKYTPDSMNTYKSRVRTSIDDFLRYQQNPLAFKPAGGGVAQRKKPSGEAKSDPAPAAPSPISRTPSPVVEATIFPIPLRPNLVVYVQGLPHDLTKVEAAKVANVIRALAADVSE